MAISSFETLHNRRRTTASFLSGKMEVEPQLLRIFAVWSSALALKLLHMSLITSRKRLLKKIFSNPEDCMFNFHTRHEKPEVMYNDPDVERTRRAHLNDLENVVPWFIVTYIWLWINPPLLAVKILVPIFVITRFLHTFFYVFHPRQPLRAIFFYIGYLMTVLEAAWTFIFFVFVAEVEKVSETTTTQN